MSIVHAQQNSLKIGLGREDIVSANTRTTGKARVSLEAKIIIFEEYGPVWQELPFRATANRPARATGLVTRDLAEIVGDIKLASAFAHAARR